MQLDDSDDNIRDSEEEEDDEDYEYRARKKRKKGRGSEFIIEEAEVDEDADEDEDAWEDDEGILVSLVIDFSKYLTLKSRFLCIVFGQT